MMPSSSPNKLKSEGLGLAEAVWKPTRHMSMPNSVARRRTVETERGRQATAATGRPIHAARARLQELMPQPIALPSSF